MSFYSHRLQEREIRLAKIEPAEFSSPIRATLQVVSLNAKLSYEALSYFCGDPEPRCTISVEGENFTIGPNLETALRHLRYHDRARTMWVDAICINQDHLAPERSQQVAMMGDIYAAASNVVVYAGDEGEHSNLALDIITEINDELQRGLDNGIRKHTNFHSSLDLGEISFFRRQLASDASFDPLPWVAINRLLRRQWWRRVWTVQEVVMPEHSIVFMCGLKSVTWVALHLVTMMIARFDFGEEHWPILYGAGYNVFYAVQPIYAIKETWHKHTRDYKLLTNLVNFYYRACSNPLDKVYAIYSLSSDVNAEIIPIDYGCRIEKLFTDVAALFVTSNRDPKFLTLCQSNGRMKSLASWAPDWNIEQVELARLDKEFKPLSPLEAFFKLVKILGKERRPPVPLANWIGSTNHSFKAATGIPQSLAVVTRNCSDMSQQRLLSIQGRTHSRMLQIGKDIFQLQDQPVWHWLELVEKHIKDPYSTGESRLEALWRTLVTNRASNMQVAKRNLFELALSADATKLIKAGFEDPQKRFLLGNTLMRDFAALVYRAMSGRRFFVTDNGFMGLAPADVKEGDRILLLFDLEVPMVLRDLEDDTVEVIGACYCHGIMEGEGLTGKADSDLKTESLLLN